MTDLSIANNIYYQLGGNKFRAMTGAHTFVAGKNSLSFKLPRNKSKANYCQIDYDYATDLYSIKYLACRIKPTIKLEKIAVFNDIGCEKLVEIHEQITGQVTRL